MSLAKLDYPITRSRMKSTKFSLSIRLAAYKPAKIAVIKPTPITKSIAEIGITGMTYKNPLAISLIA